MAGQAGTHPGVAPRRLLRSISKTGINNPTLLQSVSRSSAVWFFQCQASFDAGSQWLGWMGRESHLEGSGLLSPGRGLNIISVWLPGCSLYSQAREHLGSPLPSFPLLLGDPNVDFKPLRLPLPLGPSTCLLSFFPPPNLPGHLRVKWFFPFSTFSFESSQVTRQR